MSIQKALRGFALAACVAGALAPALSSAALVTRQFEFTSADGPLLFGPNVGSFTYDDSVVPVGGGFVNAVGLFTDLSVAFDAFSYDESTANSGWLWFDVLGNLTEAHFGNNCGPGSCTIAGGQPHWWIRVGIPGTTNDFSYSGFNGATGFHTTNRNRLLDAQVPEPATLALLGAALVGLARTRRRR